MSGQYPPRNCTDKFLIMVHYIKEAAVLKVGHIGNDFLNVRFLVDDRQLSFFEKGNQLGNLLGPNIFSASLILCPFSRTSYH